MKMTCNFRNCFLLSILCLIYVVHGNEGYNYENYKGSSNLEVQKVIQGERSPLENGNAQMTTIESELVQVSTSVEAIKDCYIENKMIVCPKGKPEEYHQLKYEYRSLLQSVCKPGQASYAYDGDGNDIRCGDCVPGTASVPHFLYSKDETLNLYCPLNHYCNDSAICKPIVESPFYMLPCSYDSLYFGADASCGIGLRCINQRCRMCINGETQDGALCVNGQWTRSAFVKDWIMTGIGPSTMALLAFFAGSTSITFCMKLCCNLILILRRKQLQQMRKAMKRSRLAGRIKQ